MSLTVLLAGGGTAGHVEPALSVADALMRRDADNRVTMVGTESGLEARLVPARGFRLALIPRVPLPRRPTREVLTVPGRLAGAVRATTQVIDEVAPDVVVGFGGYVALPAYLAARRASIPYIVHEANARPGLANRIGALGAAGVGIGFPGTSLRNAQLVGLPLRRSLTTMDRQTNRRLARDEWGLAPDRPTVLAFGGSQGAASLNAAVPSAAPRLVEAGAQVLLATGAGRVGEAERALAGSATHVHIVEYLDRMDLAYAAADVVVCRAGAMTVAEVTALGLPAVFVPLPIGNGEQRLNAEPVVAAGGGLCIPDDELSAQRLVADLLPLVLDEGQRTTMGRRAQAFGRPDADDVLVDMVYAVAGVRGLP